VVLFPFFLVLQGPETPSLSTFPPLSSLFPFQPLNATNECLNLVPNPCLSIPSFLKHLYSCSRDDARPLDGAPLSFFLRCFCHLSCPISLSGHVHYEGSTSPAHAARLCRGTVFSLALHPTGSISFSRFTGLVRQIFGAPGLVFCRFPYSVCKFFRCKRPFGLSCPFSPCSISSPPFFRATPHGSTFCPRKDSSPLFLFPSSTFLILRPASCPPDPHLKTTTPPFALDLPLAPFPCAAS